MSNTTMTKRERVMTALNHKEPDKIPLDCGGMRSTGITGVVYNNLKEYLGIKRGETRMYDMIQQLAIPEDWYLKKFNIDVYDLAFSLADSPEDWIDWSLPDGSQAKIPAWFNIEQRGKDWVCVDGDGDVLAEMPEGSYFFDQKYWPLYGKHKENFNDLADYFGKVMWAYMSDPTTKDAGDPDYYSILRETAKELYEESDFAIMALFGGQLFEMGQYLYRNDEFLANLIGNRQEMEKMLDKLTEINLANLEKFLDVLSPYVQIIVFGDDLGTQNGPMLSPELYREMFLPRHKKMYQLVKEKTDMKVFMHNCGAIREFMPDLIEAGVDIINPVQTSAEGMDIRELKKEFGRDLVFWGGGVDTQHTLRKGSEEDVRDEVKRNCELLMKDGGFVFNQVHNMLPGIPPQNIVAMYNEVNKITY